METPIEFFSLCHLNHSSVVQMEKDFHPPKNKEHNIVSFYVYGMCSVISAHAFEFYIMQYMHHTHHLNHPMYFTFSYVHSLSFCMFVCVIFFFYPCYHKQLKRNKKTVLLHGVHCTVFI